MLAKMMMDPVAFLLVFLGLALVGVIACGPGFIAKSRKHSKASAIMLCGICGTFTLGILWIIALIWAHTEDNRGGQQRSLQILTPTKRKQDEVYDVLPADPDVTLCGMCGVKLRMKPGQRGKCPKCGALVQAA